MNYVISLLLAFAFAMPAVAKGVQYPCYGEKEKRLARSLLVGMPLLATSLEQQERTAKRVRNETCAVIAQTGRIADIDYSYAFFGESRNRAIWIAAEARGLEPLRVQAAIVDTYWPAKTT